MARTFGAGNYLSPGAATPLQITGDITIAAWLKSTTALEATILGAYNAGSPFTGYSLAMGISPNAGKLAYWSNAIGAWQFSTGTVNDGALHHVGLTIIGTGAGAGTFYIDGVASGTWTHTAPGAFTGSKQLGARSDGGNPFIGDLAELAVWNAGLSAAEMAALGKRVSPALIRPASRIAYWKITGRDSPEHDDWQNALAATLTGTPATADHPPIFYPWSPPDRRTPTATAATVTLDVATAAAISTTNADVVIDASVVSNLQDHVNDRAEVVVSASVIYQFGIDVDTDLKYWKSTDGGATWAAAVLVATLPVNSVFSIWYDKWTPGNSGTKIHVAYIETVADDVFYNSLNTSGDTLGTAVVVFNGASFAADFDCAVTIAVARGGNLYIAFQGDTGTETGFYRSIDAGVNWTSRADPNEATTDYYSLFPGNESDNQDMWLVFWDRSADTLSLKTYDDSANSWAETTISASMTDVSRATVANQFYGSVRHSDNHLIVVAWNSRDVATADLQCWDINGAASITAKTNVVTNSDDCDACALFIDQTTGYLYCAYLGKSDGSQTLGTAVGVYYRKSTDGGATWGAETAFSIATNLDLTVLTCDLGGTASRFIPVFFDEGNDDLLTTIPGVALAPSSVSVDVATAASLGAPALATRDVATAAAIGDQGTIKEKELVAKVFNAAGTYIGVLADWDTVPTFAWPINSGPGTMEFDLARVWGDAGQPGDDATVDTFETGYIIKLYVIDRESGVDGILLYQGTIKELRYNLFGGISGGTLVPKTDAFARHYIEEPLDFVDQDPSTIAQYLIDNGYAAGATWVGTNPLAGVLLTLTIERQTVDEAMKLLTQMAGGWWFWRLNVDYTVTFKASEQTQDIPTHALRIGMEVSPDVEFTKTIVDQRQHVLVYGANIEDEEGNVLGQIRGEASSVGYDPFVDPADYVSANSRITDQATADAIAYSYLESLDVLAYQTEITVADSNYDPGKGYDIESLHPGDTVRLADPNHQFRFPLIGDHIIGDGHIIGGPSYAQALQTFVIAEMRYEWRSAKLTLKFKPDRFVEEIVSIANRVLLTETNPA